MAPAIVHLPNGQNLTVTPVFGGLYFKSNELITHHASHSPFPPGWTIVLHTDDGEPDDKPAEDANGDEEDRPTRRHATHRFTRPTLHNDHLYISSISNPNSADFKPATSPSRQLAMMLWATLWWYFHQPEPDLRLTTKDSQYTADAGKPKGEWRVNIGREGIFKGKVILPKLERMGLVSTEESSVGIDPEDRNGDGWKKMFVSRRSFWQLDARIYLFTLSPASSSSPYPGTPYGSRPSSPSGQKDNRDVEAQNVGLWSPSAPGPFHSSSHLPTYYPPPPPQYIFTNGIRHPIRPKPYCQGETFYTRYVPSVGQYLSFRVACLSSKPIPHRGPVSQSPSTPAVATLRHPPGPVSSLSDSAVPTVSNAYSAPCDTELLHKWMNDPRIAHSWGETGPRSHQESFLKHNLQSRHSFPVIGCWDGKPFGYFEIYWVKEDRLGAYLGGNCGDYDRGLHVLVGEQEFRGRHRVRCWISALVHYCFLADYRTETVVLEPRVDNGKLKEYLEESGFYKEREISFPHKQSNLMKIRRDGWEAPAL